MNLTVMVMMLDGEKQVYHSVEEISFHTEFDRIVIFQNNRKDRTIIPVDSFMFYTEEDY